MFAAYTCSACPSLSPEKNAASHFECSHHARAGHLDGPER